MILVVLRKTPHLLLIVETNGDVFPLVFGSDLLVTSSILAQLPSSDDSIEKCEIIKFEYGFVGDELIFESL